MCGRRRVRCVRGRDNNKMDEGVRDKMEVT